MLPINIKLMHYTGFNSPGVYDLRVATLCNAPDDIVLIRDVKPWYIAKLKEDISSERGDHEDITSPLVVIASVTVDEFNEEDIDDYTYYVICMYLAEMVPTCLLSLA